jgi:hypothetical protein
VTSDDESRLAPGSDAPGAAPGDAAGPEVSHGDAKAGFLSSSPDRREAESVFVRVIATAGVVAVGTALGAVLVANNVAGWIVGLAVAVVSVVLAAILWRSRSL